MKKHIFICAVFYLVVCNSCKPKYENPYSDDIVGKWKLVEVEISRATNYQPYERQLEIINYSNDNIIYEFQANNKLIVSGVIIDTLSLFECFKEGEHFYEYQKPNVCPTCLPGKNLSIDKHELGKEKGRYFCMVPINKQTMTIGTGQPDGYEWGWTFKLIILK